MSESYNYFHLPSGLKVVYRFQSGHTEYCGLAVNVGSRDDNHLHGLAHFVEHTIFKGTSSRRSWQIINRMESVGGELNAFTTKEETAVYSIFPAGNLNRAVELLADLLTASVFPSPEIDREREVIAEEINSYLDTPAESVFDEFEEKIFDGSALAHNILGTTESVGKITSAHCRKYLADYYRAGNMVFFYLGPEPMAKVERIASRHLCAIPAGNAARSAERTSPSIVEPFKLTRHIDSHQAHAVIGTRIPGMYEADRYAISLLTNILGGPGMNSRLNVALRERRGLVYAVDASTAMFTDSGLFTVYFGCDTADAERCRRLVINEVDRLAQSPLTEAALAKAKKQYLGQITVASDSREHLALSMARATLYHNGALTHAEIAERVNSVTPQRINEAAASLLPLSSLILL